MASPCSSPSPAQSRGARLLLSLGAVVNADRDNGVGDERAVAAILVEQLQTAHHHRHAGTAVGERGSHLIDLHLFRARHSDRHVHYHLVSSGTHQSGESETTVVNGVKDGALGRQRVIQTVDIHPHPHFRHAAHQCHYAPSCPRSCSWSG